MSRRTADAGERHARIYREIRERISLLRYPPGTVLSETELAGEFGVSRTPLRRVLHQLAFEGLVEARNGVGTIVTDIDIGTFKKTYELRMALAELMGVLSPGQPTPALIASIEKMIERARALRENRDVEAYARLANDLEDLMLELIDNDPLRQITDQLYYRVSRIWFTFLPNLDWDAVIDSQILELSEMHEAMKRGDVRGVGQIRRLHLHGIMAWVSGYLAPAG